jgi:large subunit ribosomal protein L3
MPDIKAPRKGSLAFYPRKRARRIYPTIRSYPNVDKTKLLAFAGYKVGMRTLIAIDQDKNSPTFGQEVAIPVTILETPPLFIAGIRFYQKTTSGLKTLTEVWAKNLPKDLERKIKIKPKKEIEDLEKFLNKTDEVRVIAVTLPKRAGIRKKKPEVLEIPLGGKNTKEKFEFAKNLLGKEVSIEDVFSVGELVDVIAITKGKGTQGPVKRFGVKIQVRKAKKKRRHVGALGSQVPRKVLWTVPMPGQMGFQRRTEYNKRILMIANGDKLNLKSGYKHYGILKEKGVVLHGSVPGSKKRLVILRAAIRPTSPNILNYEIKGLV